jgi:dTDP-4-amino-4,6-dideoxygalactose transaminase
MGSLHLALQTIGIGPGDEVIVDPIVVFGGMAVMYQNAVPVFADIDLETYNIDPKSVSERITSRTKAIICTHHFGNICDMKSISLLAKQHHIPVIEDCAHALYATQNEKFAGLFGDFGAFSFNHRKQLSTGQGGFLLINSKDYAEKSKDQGFGRIPARVTPNYAMSGIVAAIAIAQWEKAKTYVRKDNELATLYTESLEDCNWLKPQKIPKENWSPYHIWAATFTGDEYGINYNEFMKELKRNNADYFLPSFMPHGAFDLEPSPSYRYPIFSEPSVNWIVSSKYQSLYEGKIDYSKGLCPNAEYVVPRMLNTTISPVENERVEIYAKGLRKTIKHFTN